MPEEKNDISRREMLKMAGAAALGLVAGGGVVYAVARDDAGLRLAGCETVNEGLMEDYRTATRDRKALIEERSVLMAKNKAMERQLMEELTGTDNFRASSPEETVILLDGQKTVKRAVWKGEPETVTMEIPTFVGVGGTFYLVYRWDSTNVPKEQRGGIFVTQMLYTDWKTTAKMKKYQPRMPGRPIAEVDGLPLTPVTGIRLHPDEESYKRLFEGGDGTELDATYKKFEVIISIRAPDYRGTQRIRMLHASHWGTVAGFNGNYMIDGIHNPRPRWDADGKPDTGTWIIPNYTLVKLPANVPGLQLTIDVI